MALKLYLLFISYKFVKGFLAITFFYFLFPAETCMMCVNVFYVVRNEISAASDKRQRISPKASIVKITHFGYVMSIDKWAIFTMGVYGEISHFLSDPTKIPFLTA